MTQRHIIIANGDMNDYPWYKTLLREDDFIVCADGGARHTAAMNIIPDVILGDFDSLASEIRETFQNTGCRFESYPVEKDATDTELALKWCLKLNPREVIFLGAVGSRIDHSLANILLLARVAGRVPVKLINEQNEITVLTGAGTVEIYGTPGEFVSVLPLAGDLRGISTRGLKYILRNDVLKFGTTRGIANELADQTAYVEVKEGIGLVIRAWEIPRGLR